VEQIACSASVTSSTIRSGVLTALKLTSGLLDEFLGHRYKLWPNLGSTLPVLANNSPNLLITP
jgi:hypothetical protein